MTVAMAAAVATVPLFGGRLTRLLEIRLRLAWLVPVALLVQIAAISIFPDADSTVLLLALLGSYVLGAAFLLANIGVPGMWLIVLGAALNTAAILANGGVMPADPVAVERAGIGDHEGFVNSAANEDARLAPLGDNFAWPAPLPLANVFSVGDIVLVVGAVVLLHRVCGSRLPGRARPHDTGRPTER
jgi:hypothetical protein